MELPPGVKPDQIKASTEVSAPLETGAVEGGREFRLLKEDLSKMGRKLEQHGSLIEINRTTTDEIRKDISEINVNIKDLLAIYEYVSQQFNPFTETEPGDEDASPEKTASESHFNLVDPVMSPLEGTNREEPSGLLTRLPRDPLINVLVLRWMEYLLQRVKREHIPSLMDYYVQVNWISKEVREQLLAYIRGEVPDVTSYEPETIPETFPELDEHNEIKELKHHLNCKVVDEWRMSADDHLKSYLFIHRILGQPMDKNSLNQVELEVKTIKGNLKNYYGL